MRQRMRVRPSVKGMSLVELLMASGVMSIVALVFASQMISQKKATLQIQTVVTRNLLQMRLQQALTRSSTLTTTANHSSNTTFTNC